MQPVQQGYSSIPPSPHDHIPFTGFDVGFLVVGSVILLTVGMALRRLIPSD